MKQVNPIVKDFYDFYSIVELYNRSGGFRDNPKYRGYPVFVSWRAEEKIKNTYEEIVNKFYADVHGALNRSIKSELRHFPEMTFIDFDNSEKYRTLKAYRQAVIGYPWKFVNRVKKNPSYNPRVVKAIFLNIKWDDAYGGKKWAKGAQLLIDAESIKTLSDKVYWIDRVLDLYHNSGHMIDKTQFRVLSHREYRKPTHLNLRKRSRDIFAFLPYNSTRVKKLVIPQKRILSVTQNTKQKHD